MTLLRIIEPLSSRCVKFRFKPVSEESQVQRLKYICEQEGLVYSTEVHSMNTRTHLKALLKLVEISEGDLRKSINVLQSTGLLYDRDISQDSVIDISGVKNSFFSKILIDCS
jgi:replication factor C subunit 2/4